MQKKLKNKWNNKWYLLTFIFKLTLKYFPNLTWPTLVLAKSNACPSGYYVKVKHAWAPREFMWGQHSRCLFISICINVVGLFLFNYSSLHLQLCNWPFLKRVKAVKQLLQILFESVCNRFKSWALRKWCSM